MLEATTFGQWLKQQRRALGLTQKDLARQAGCAEVTLRKIEAGNLQPSAQLAVSLAKSAGAGITDLPAIVESALDAGAALAGRSSKSRRPHNLPAQLTPLLGREQDIAAVRKRLVGGDARLVTLLGPPGVGKTRLAQAVAEHVLDQFEDGAFFVRLGPLGDPGHVAPAIALTLGVQMRGPHRPDHQLRAYLEEKHLLLVLDNFEHVVEAAPLVDDLLRRCPWLHILVTSRQPLRVRGERQAPVLPLALPAQGPSAAQLTACAALEYSAVALFEDRAQAVQPDFAVTDANASAVAHLCRQLDGLPLAIELVAARVKLLSPEDLLAQLRGPWMLSVDGLRDVSARQRTLRGAIGWSYDLLSPAEQTIFTRLAVFNGGFTLQAAEAVCGAASFHALDGIASLLDKSLLRREIGLHGESRYAMLETIRAYALERLAAGGDASDLRNHHLAWCLTVAAPMVSSPFAILKQADWKQVDAEILNLSAGLEWAFHCDPTAALQLVLAISRTLANRGFVREARALIDRALTLPEATETPLDQAALLFCKGIAEFLADLAVEAEGSLSRSLALSRDLGSVLGQAGALYYLGRLATMAGNAPRAMANLEAAAEELLEAGEIADWGHAISVLAEVVMFCGDLQRSRDLHMQAMARPLPPEQRHQVLWSVAGLAELALVEGNFTIAQRLAEECLALCRQKDHPGETAWLLTCLGEIATRRGDFAAAHANLHEALTLGRKADAYWRIVIVRADFGDLAVAEGRPAEALRLYRETLPILLQRGSFAHPQGSLRLACLASAVGRHEVAATLLGACSLAVENGLEVLLPITQSDFERVLAAARSALDANAFETAWATGRKLGPQAAVTWGLQAIRVSDQPLSVEPDGLVAACCRQSAPEQSCLD